MILPIYVKRVTDYEPNFLVEEIRVNLTENLPPGSQPFELPSTVQRDEVDDLDDPPGIVCYFIVYGNEQNLFHLDPLSHIITVIIENLTYTYYIFVDEKSNNILLIIYRPIKSSTEKLYPSTIL